MKETGIIMSGNHPSLVLEKLKTMTRRTAGLNKINETPDDWVLDDTLFIHKGKLTACFLPKDRDPSKAVFVSCPYGQVGDRLWVRETYMTDSRGNLHYKASEPDWVALTQNKTSIRIAWKPSIHMFRKDARILLEITGLRAERLQEISEADILAEGIQYPVLPNGGTLLRVTGKYPPSDYLGKECFKDGHYIGTEGTWLKAHFISLWDSLNAKRGYGWDFNPWDWPISFRLLEAAK